jgi:hypothetical protein
MQVRSTSARALLVAAPSTGKSKVRAAERAAVEGALAKLPAADRALLAKHRLKVELVPKAALEDGMLGATTVHRERDGTWVPTRIRVASRLSDRSGMNSLAEVAQHEVGHALAVLRRQDRTEDAAEAYARRH